MCKRIKKIQNWRGRSRRAVGPCGQCPLPWGQSKRAPALLLHTHGLNWLQPTGLMFWFDKPSVMDKSCVQAYLCLHCTFLWNNIVPSTLGYAYSTVLLFVHLMSWGSSEFLTARRLWTWLFLWSTIPCCLQISCLVQFSVMIELSVSGFTCVF